MNIVVLAGGTSSERAISIVSGKLVTQALRSAGHDALLTDVFCGLPEQIIHAASESFQAACKAQGDLDAAAEWMHSNDDHIGEIKNSRRSFFAPCVLPLCEAADAVFMALHGSNGEDGKIQAAFELMGIKYTGSSYLGSALAMDKETAKQLFRENSVPTPLGIVVRRGQSVLPAALNGVGLPCVVKPSCGGSSVGVSVARTEEEYQAAISEGFQYEPVLIVEQYIAGREFSVGIVDDTPYPVIEIAPLEGFYNYHNKYQPGSTVETCPADLPEDVAKKMQAVALDAYHTLRVNNYGRVDIMMAEDGSMYCLEVNTLPGMTPTSLLPQEAAALGISFPQLCENLIRISLR